MNNAPVILSLTIGAMMVFGCAGKNELRRTSLQSVTNWVCVYSADVPTEQIAKFDLAVLDADAHPPLVPLQGETTLLGYISLGEVADYRWYWPEIEKETWVLARNPNWQSRFVDVRTEAWHRFVLDKIIPKILVKGFDGLFLDTLDTAEYLERYHPEKKYPGSEAAMIRLIHSIRKKYPSIYLMANRGFAILEQVADDIDGVLAESLFSSVDFETNMVRLRPEAEYQDTLEKLRSVRSTAGVQVFTLDYLADASLTEREVVLQRSRRESFVPYISTVQLDRIFTLALEQEL